MRLPDDSKLRLTNRTELNADSDTFSFIDKDRTYFLIEYYTTKGSYGETRPERLEVAIYKDKDLTVKQLRKLKTRSNVEVNEVSEAKLFWTLMQTGREEAAERLTEASDYEVEP